MTSLASKLVSFQEWNKKAFQCIDHGPPSLFILLPQRSFLAEVQGQGGANGRASFLIVTSRVSLPILAHHGIRTDRHL